MQRAIAGEKRLLQRGAKLQRLRGKGCHRSGQGVTKQLVSQRLEGLGAVFNLAEIARHGLGLFLSLQQGKGAEDCRQRCTQIVRDVGDGLLELQIAVGIAPPGIPEGAKLFVEAVGQRQHFPIPAGEREQGVALRLPLPLESLPERPGGLAQKMNLPQEEQKENREYG